MGADLNFTIPVAVEFGSPLSDLLDADKTQVLEHRLTAKLSDLLQQLGLAGEPATEFKGVDSNRAVRVRVYGELQPYSPDLMKRLWRAIAPADLRGIPEITEMARQP